MGGSLRGALGWMYYKGEGVPQDYAQAHMWYKLGSVTSRGSRNS